MTYAMVPLLPTDKNEQLADKVIELISCNSALAGKMHQGVQDGIGDLVRSMNCYYSNLIEGHNTRPRDIERALQDDYSPDSKRRVLQKEARAHIDVQKLIEQGGATDVDPASDEYLRWLHYEFCSRLPEDLLWVENPDTKEHIAVIPGEYRTTHVQVGRHIPPAYNEIEVYIRRGFKMSTTVMAYLEQRILLLWRLRIIGCYGYIHLLTAMVVWQDYYHTQCCLSVVLVVVFGLFPAA